MCSYISRQGSVNVQGLTTGMNYFISVTPGHCTNGLRCCTASLTLMHRIAVAAAPPQTVWNITLWSASNTSAAIFATITGVDSLQRVWASPEFSVQGANRLLALFFSLVSFRNNRYTTPWVALTRRRVDLDVLISSACVAVAARA
jgi:hypothetical protein